MKIDLKNFDNPDTYTKLSILILLIGIAIRFYLASAYHVAGDACWQLSNSRFIAQNLRLPLFEHFGRDEPFWAPPLFHIFYAFIYLTFRNFGINAAEFAVKMISPLLGSLTLIIFLSISKILFDKKTAFYSLIFLSFIPLHMDYSVFSYVDGMLTFLAVLSVYFSLKNKIASSAITAGLAILTKYNGIFILPVILYIVYINNKKEKYLFKKFSAVLAISLAIGSIWFARNWIYLGNPVWPFMNTIFNGIKVKSFAESSVGAVNLSNIININSVKFIYLGIFGIPDGNINTLLFFNIPYLKLLFAVWLLGTLIFSIPFFAGLSSKKLKHRTLLSIWIISYVILVLLYVINASWAVSRFLLPAFPAIALIWGHGLKEIKYKNIKNLLMLLITIIVIGFVFTSFIKISLASKSWNVYNKDFEWVKSNTNKNSIFITASQCISYNIQRQTLSPYPENLENADYIFSNQNFKLDKLAILDGQILNSIKSNGYKMDYYNNKTGTSIYSVGK